MTRPSARALEREIEKGEHADRDRHHQRLVERVAGAEEREEREVDDRRNAVLDRVAAPDHDHELGDQIGEAEREQDLADVPLLVHVAQAVSARSRAPSAPHDAAAR